MQKAINPPQIQFSGSVGPGGKYPLFNSASIDLTTDADYTLSYPAFTASVLCFTSSVSLTTTRKIIAPTAAIDSPSGFGFEYAVQNQTMGGQALLFVGATGNGVTIPNGQAAFVFFNGADYVGGGGGAAAPSPPFLINQIGTKTNQNGAITIGDPTNPLLPASASSGGVHRLTYYYFARNGAGYAQLVVRWNDGQQSRDELIKPLDEPDMWLEGQIMIRVPNNQSIQYFTNHGGNLIYDLYLSLEKLF